MIAMKKTKGIHLCHILVQHKFEADDLLRLLKQGTSFAELAKKFSRCPSAKAGGDLGCVNPESLDDQFREAAEDLKSGEITKTPVRTKFGYHLIMKP